MLLKRYRLITFNKEINIFKYSKIRDNRILSDFDILLLLSRGISLNSNIELKYILERTSIYILRYSYNIRLKKLDLYYNKFIYKY